MTLTIGLMALSTAAIGLLPTYAQIGMAAPILLVCARLVQGFAAGGELGASTMFLFESSGSGRRARNGSWQLASQDVAGVLVGLIGFGLARSMSEASLYDWGWRVPFILGLLIAPVGIYIRAKVHETHDVANAHGSAKGVLTDLLRGNWANLLLAIAMFSGVTITQYFLGYMTTFALTSLHMPPTTAMLVGFTVGVSTFVFALVGGWLADRFGLKATAFWPRVLLVIAVYPAMAAIVGLHTPAALLTVAALLMAPQAISGAVTAVVVAYAFPAAIRATGRATALGIGAALFGGTAQLVITWLIGITGDPLSPVWYVIVMNIVSAIAALILLRRRADQSPAPRVQLLQTPRMA